MRTTISALARRTAALLLLALGAFGAMAQSLPQAPVVEVFNFPLNSVPGALFNPNARISGPLGVPLGTAGFTLHNLSSGARTPLCAPILLNVLGEALCPVITPAEGDYELEIDYVSGDLLYLSGTTPFIFHTRRTVPSIGLSGFPSLVAAGEPLNVVVTLTAQTLPAAPTGSVAFRIRDLGTSILTDLCNAVPLVLGDAGCSFNAPSAVGSHRLEVTYSGDISNAPKDYFFSLDVVAAPPPPGSTVVRNFNDSGPDSLREAINAANASCSSEPTYVTFAIDGTGPFTITPLSQLPPLLCDIVIDGTSQFGWQPNRDTGGSDNALLQIALDGSQCPNCSGITIAGAPKEAVVRGLAIYNFAIAAINAEGPAAVYGNYLGTDPGGMTALGNNYGVFGFSGSLRVGSSLAKDRNVITANSTGVYVGDTASIQNNLIGGRSDGSAGAGNTIGIHFNAAGPSAANANYIRYNTYQGAATSASTTAHVGVGGNINALNAGLAFDLKGDGQTLVSPPVSAPVITSALYMNGHTYVVGYVNTLPGAFAVVEFFSNSRVGPITEGEVLQSTQGVGADSDGIGRFDFFFPDRLVPNLSAIATISICDGCTASSEYSPTVVTVPAGPSLSLSRSMVTFAPILVGASAAPQTVTLTNSGSAALNISSVAASAGFSVAGCGSTLAVGASCDLQVAFTAAAQGTFTGSVSIASDAPGSPHVVSLAASGMLPPQFSIATFATRTPGQVSTVSIFIRNIFGNPAPFSGFQTNLDYPAGFTNDPTRPVQESCGGSPYTTTAGGITSIGSAAAGSVSPGVTCTVVSAQIFVPTTPGTYTFVIPAGGFTIASPFAYSNPSPITATVVVAATAPAPPVATAAPSSLTFASRTIATTSAPQTVTVSNAGPGALAIASIIASGDFAAATTCGTTLPAGQNCAIDITFTPSTAGTRTGSLTIATNASAGTFSIPLTGSGAAPPPAITLTPGSLAFVARTPNTTSAAQSVTVTNTGSGILTIASIVATGDFAFTSTCATTLGPGQTCAITVTFTPLTTGARTGSITIASNASGSPHVISLSGAGQFASAAVIEVAPSVDFPAQQVGTRGSAETIAIVNAGNATLSLDAITIDGDFVLLPGVSATSTYERCGAALFSGATCAVEVQFAPTLSGLRRGFLHITGNATNSPVLVRLVGTGTVAAPPARALTLDGALRFPDQAVGTHSAARAVTITNTSPATVAITDLAASGDFSVSDTCTTIAARGTCSPQVVFAPTAVGERSGTLTIRNLGEATPYVVGLSGLGVFNPIAQITLSVTRVGFGNTLQAVPATARVVVTNVGQVPVATESFLATGDFLVTNACGISIAVGASCAIDVSFYPRHTGTQGGTLEIRTNAAGSPHAVQLSGTGCAVPSLGRARSGMLLCGS